MVRAPLVSVVLMTHNRPAWLAEALSSVLAGELEDLEVVVSNNGDPEDTRRLRRAVPDPRVRWFEQDQRLGMLENLLAGLAQARGRYVAILHDDDRWSPRFLAVLVPALERRPDAVFAFCDHEIIDQDGAVDVEATEVSTRQFGRAELREGYVRPFFHLVVRQSIKITGCVWRRDALDASELVPGVAPHLDVWLPYLLARRGGGAFYSPERLMSYRMHAGGHSASRDTATWLAGVQCEEQLLADPNLREHEDLLTRRLAVYHRLAGEGLLRQGTRRRARAHLRAAMRLRPTPRTVAGLAASWVAPTSLLGRL
jgi:glycosyltransferase involved in cell wall biosynthesis